MTTLEAPAPTAHDAPTPGVGPTPLRAAVISRFGDVAYAVLDLIPAIAAFTIVVVLFSVGAGLAVVYVGVPIIVLGLLIARGMGAAQRGLARRLLGLPTPSPGPIVRRRPGAVGDLVSVLIDPTAWRAVGYFVLKIALAPVTFAVAVTALASGLGAVSYPVWRPFLPVQYAEDGSAHRGAEWWPDFFIDTWPRMLLLAVAGLLVFVAALWATRFLVTIDRLLIGALLGERAGTRV